MSVLILDIGNTQTKIGWFESGVLTRVSHLETDKADLPYYRLWLLRELDGQNVEGIGVTSVVPEANKVLEEPFRDVSLSAPVWLVRGNTNGLDLAGVDISSYAPEQLGADRIANLVAGRQLLPGVPVVLCDVGTTTTVDLLDGQGRYLGGAICPGPMNVQSLVRGDRAAQLYEVDLFSPPELIPGRDTTSSLAIGLNCGYRGMMRDIIDTLLDQTGWSAADTRIVFTGGLGEQTLHLM